MNNIRKWNSKASAGINQFALSVVIIVCVAIYFKPTAMGLNEALKSHPQNSFESIANEPELKNTLPDPIPPRPGRGVLGKNRRGRRAHR